MTDFSELSTLAGDPELLKLFRREPFKARAVLNSRRNGSVALLDEILRTAPKGMVVCALAANWLGHVHFHPMNVELLVLRMRSLGIPLSLIDPDAGSLDAARKAGALLQKITELDADMARAYIQNDINGGALPFQGVNRSLGEMTDPAARWLDIFPDFNARMLGYCGYFGDNRFGADASLEDIPLSLAECSEYDQAQAEITGAPIRVVLEVLSAIAQKRRESAMIIALGSRGEGGDYSTLANKFEVVRRTVSVEQALDNIFLRDGGAGLAELTSISVEDIVKQIGGASKAERDKKILRTYVGNVLSLLSEKEAIAQSDASAGKNTFKVPPLHRSPLSRRPLVESKAGTNYFLVAPASYQWAVYTQVSERLTKLGEKWTNLRGQRLEAVTARIFMEILGSGAKGLFGVEWEARRSPEQQAARSERHNREMDVLVGLDRVTIHAECKSGFFRGNVRQTLDNTYGSAAGQISHLKQTIARHGIKGLTFKPGPHMLPDKPERLDKRAIAKDAKKLLSAPIMIPVAVTNDDIGAGAVSVASSKHSENLPMRPMLLSEMDLRLAARLLKGVEFTAYLMHRNWFTNRYPASGLEEADLLEAFLCDGLIDADPPSIMDSIHSGLLGQTLQVVQYKELLNRGASAYRIESGWGEEIKSILRELDLSRPKGCVPAAAALLAAPRKLTLGGHIKAARQRAQKKLDMTYCAWEVREGQSLKPAIELYFAFLPDNFSANEAQAKLRAAIHKAKRERPEIVFRAMFARHRGRLRIMLDGDISSCLGLDMGS
ncbi:hypothetical protein [Streptomyces sp. NPDC088816]|uniref:hypothetical protein n=1 Tax=Streptomyces sp. NPDC088816 TaxID=3365906 RepID=UPI0038306B65